MLDITEGMVMHEYDEGLGVYIHFFGWGEINMNECDEFCLQSSIFEESYQCVSGSVGAVDSHTVAPLPINATSNQKARPCTLPD